jgi:Cu(I)/Ag(I) efflux system membrane fusion protein
MINKAETFILLTLQKFFYQMRKVLIAFLIFVVGGLALYFFWKKDRAPARDKPKPLPIAENTGSFNQSFGKLLTAYYELKDALVDGDSAKASAKATLLAKAADSLKTSEIKGDSTGVIKETANNYVQTITASCKAIPLESGLEEKRKDFGTIAESMFNLVRTVKYSGQKVYWEYCPMAFNKKGAYWMSNDTVIKNPYMGKDMVDCGSVEDSLDYSKK